MPTPRNNGPLYLQFARAIQERIDTGEYPPGSRLPSEPELCGQFGANRLTVRQAIAELDRAGAIEIRRGVGTFVRRPVVRATIDVDPNSARLDVGSQSVPVPVRDLKGTEERAVEVSVGSDTAPDRQAAEHLRLPTSALTRIDTVIVISAQPWAVNSYWVATHLLPTGFAESTESRNTTVAVAEAIGIELEYDWRSFSAIAADIADAQRLDVAAGSPLLLREGVSCAPDGRPILYVRRRIYGENASFVMRYREWRQADQDSGGADTSG
ncbi:GntR family transcriptional regulator [Kitasatospora sp. NPDC059812]|uniref:GntR family transcriptional regulator n=1 Tax=Kitasatospora sp. NPDC059812 TaxID=3346958 RepID=UPI003669D5CA